MPFSNLASGTGRLPFEADDGVTELQGKVLALLEAANIPTQINDRIVEWIAQGERLVATTATKAPYPTQDTAVEMREWLISDILAKRIIAPEVCFYTQNQWVPAICAGIAHRLEILQTEHPDDWQTNDAYRQWIIDANDLLIYTEAAFGRDAAIVMLRTDGRFLMRAFHEAANMPHLSGLVRQFRSIAFT